MVIAGTYRENYKAALDYWALVNINFYTYILNVLVPL